MLWMHIVNIVIYACTGILLTHDCRLKCATWWMAGNIYTFMEFMAILLICEKITIRYMPAMKSSF